MQAAITDQFPQVLVILKAMTTDHDEKLKHLKVDYQREADKPTIIDT